MAYIWTTFNVDGEDLKPADDHLRVLTILHEALQKCLQINHGIDRLIFQKIEVKADDHFVVFRKWTKQVVILENNARIKMSEELVEHVLTHLSCHVLSRQNLFLDEFLDIYVFVG